MSTVNEICLVTLHMELVTDRFMKRDDNFVTDPQKITHHVYCGSDRCYKRILGYNVYKL